MLLWIEIFSQFYHLLLLVYRNTTIFVYWSYISVTLLSLFISPNGFSVKSLGFSLYKIMSSANIVLFTPFQPYVFILFSCLIFQASTSSIMLNTSGKSRHSCFQYFLTSNVSLNYKDIFISKENLSSNNSNHFYKLLLIQLLLIFSYWT